MLIEHAAGPDEAEPNSESEYFEPHPPGRPMKFVRDADGDGWLCDQDADPRGDLREQGCWRCDEMAFPTGGR
jgi:hypothetical protein